MLNREYAPVAVFVYNRVEQTQRILDALNCNTLSDKTKIFIFSDAAKDNTEKEKVKQVRNYIQNFKNNNSFQETNLILAEKNLGLQDSLINGITRIINEYGKVIVVEDDILTSKDFLTFMNSALMYYQDDNKVWSVSGYTPRLRSLKRLQTDVYCSVRGNCWGWATWSNRWNRIDWEVSDYEKFIVNKNEIKRFNEGGKDMTSLLKLQKNGSINSWAIRWNYQQYKEQMISIFPKFSKVQNIGFDGTGTNGGIANSFNTSIKEEKEWDFQYNEKETRPAKEMASLYSRLYFRQQIGKYWYMLTEYEYCILYKINQQWHMVKPNYKEWYADPIPLEWNRQKYILVESYSKWRDKGSISVLKLGEDGRLQRTSKVIDESFHISFPSVFEYKEKIYMIPECSQSGQFRIYVMKGDIENWELYYSCNIERYITDSVAILQGESVLILSSLINKDNEHQAGLVIYKIENLENEQSLSFKEVWTDTDFKYGKRNGGLLLTEKNQLLRVVQHSTKDVYGKFISINKILCLDDNEIHEEIVKKIDITDLPISLPRFVYRIWGTHTYGKIDGLEVYDILVQRFSLSGILIKIFRRIRTKK